MRPGETRAERLDPRAVAALIGQHTFHCVGCTDPLSIALATASARSLVGGEIRHVDVVTDRNVFKNTLSVDIPGGFGQGPQLAAAAGAVVGHPEQGLLFLQDSDQLQVSAARDLVRRGLISCSADTSLRDVYVRATVVTDEGTATAVIEGGHDTIVLLERDGRAVQRAAAPAAGSDGGLGLLAGVRGVGELLDVVEQLDAADLGFLLEAVDVNLAAAAVGIEKGPGLAVGKTLAGWSGIDPLRRPASGGVRDAAALHEIVPLAEAFSAAAADARMAGLRVPIVGSFGSGNHGIVLFVTLGLLAMRFGAGADETARALALGSLLVGLVKRQTGILTPHCGCALAAGVGVAGGAAALLSFGWPREQRVSVIDLAASLVVADIFGIVCDGAKATCALKIATSATVALRNTFLAETMVLERPKATWHDLAGLGGSSLFDALDAVGVLTADGFDHLDTVTLRLLQKRQAGLGLPEHHH